MTASLNDIIKFSIPEPTVVAEVQKNKYDFTNSTITKYLMNLLDNNFSFNIQNHHFDNNKNLYLIEVKNIIHYSFLAIYDEIQLQNFQKLSHCNCSIFSITGIQCEKLISFMTEKINIHTISPDILIEWFKLFNKFQLLYIIWDLNQKGKQILKPYVMPSIIEFDECDYIIQKQPLKKFKKTVNHLKFICDTIYKFKEEFKIEEDAHLLKNWIWILMSGDFTDTILDNFISLCVPTQLENL